MGGPARRRRHLRRSSCMASVVGVVFGIRVHHHSAAFQRPIDARTRTPKGSMLHAAPPDLSCHLLARRIFMSCVFYGKNGLKILIAEFVA